MTAGGPWVLVSEGGSGESRAALATVRALALAGYRPAVTVSGEVSLAASSRYCQRRVPVPALTEGPQAYADAVRAEAEHGGYVEIFPATDIGLLALDRPVRHLLDKEVVAAGAVDAGFQVPPSRTFESRAALLDAAADLDYPVVVKPTIKHFLAAKVLTAADLAGAVPAESRYIVQPFLDETIHGVFGVVWGGRIVAAAHARYLRLWPQPLGTVSAAVTEAPDEATEAALERLLGDYEGPFAIDMAGPYLLDVNPRIHAAVAVALAAGVNIPAVACDLRQGRRVAPTRARAGVGFRWEEGDVRSVIRQRRTGELSWGQAFDALRPRRGTVHSVVSLSDPGPTLARARFLARRLRRGDPIPW